MRIPKHIAIIPDGNRRWATQHQMEKKDGYQHGLNPGLEVLRKAKEYGVAEITYYGFTVDNCKRPKVQQNAFKKSVRRCSAADSKRRECIALGCGRFELSTFSGRTFEIYTEKGNRNC